jgi:hypothetical protein
MGDTQTIDYDALARQNGAISSQPPAVSFQPRGIDYDALAKQHGAISSAPAASAPATPTGTIGPYHPTVLQRLGDFISPLVEHVRVGGAASDERLLAPEKLMTPEQQRAHPIVAGAADVAGQITSSAVNALASRSAFARCSVICAFFSSATSSARR